MQALSKHSRKGDGLVAASRVAYRPKIIPPFIIFVSDRGIAIRQKTVKSYRMTKSNDKYA
ncbi:hypothetical protein ASD52_02615 [Ensifer sp. Root142]|nr:hypothetical protein ASD52_02615 [Ensifer sp. Root142]OMQ33554.1 hypothetical protein BKP54_32765 [Ensifer sp. 1H6]PSS63786.1 hypothetical protein C6558_13855 [Ensifer sp. NM-2]